MTTRVTANRDGFTIVEVVIAVVLMAIVLTTLAGLTFSSARMAVVTADATARDAIMLTEMNRMTTLPYADLATAETDRLIGAENNRYRLEIEHIPGTAYDSVRIDVTPAQRNVPSAGVSLLRSPPARSNPLCSPC